MDQHRLRMLLVCTTLMVGSVVVSTATAGAAEHGSAKKPTFSGCTATPSGLGYTGGSAQIGATVQNARSCTFSSNMPITGLPESVACQSGPVAVSLRFPANTGTKVLNYKITLKVSSSTGSTKPVLQHDVSRLDQQRQRRRRKLRQPWLRARAVFVTDRGGAVRCYWTFL